MPEEGWLEEAVAKVFDEGLEKAYGRRVEPRPQQRELAMAVAKAFESGGKLVAEAPTGVGKTFAYLVPAILLAKETGKPAWVATESLALQDQILLNDLPAACRATGMKASGAKAMGRANHLCVLRLGELMARADDPASLAALAVWAERGGGDLSSFAARGLFPRVSAGSDEAFCSGDCPVRMECRLSMARAEAASADVVVLNHALAMLSLKAPDAEFAPPAPCCLVFDECHRMEEAASGAFGMETSLKTARTLLECVARTDPKLKEEARATAKMLNAWFHDVMRGMFMHGFGDGPMSPRKGWPPAPFALSNALSSVARGAKGPSWGFGRLLREAAQAIQAFGWGAVWKHESRWAEKNGEDVSVHCEPAFPAPLVAGSLPGGVPVAAVSATVAGRGGMGDAASAMGLADAGTLVLPSPFDFKKVRCFAAWRDMPHPNDPAYLECAAKWLLRRFLPMTRGRAFLLFTSLESLADCALIMRKGLERLNMNAIVQRKGDSAAILAERFRNTKRAVLFGCSSFWTGVDIPGEALSQVVVMKLPFPRPDEPMECAKARAMGRDWFEKRACVKALEAFRQGIGRLVRRKGDGGVIVVMDPRAARRPYGRPFIDALPVEPELF